VGGHINVEQSKSLGGVLYSLRIFSDSCEGSIVEMALYEVYRLSEELVP